MANPLKGEIEFEAGGQKYTFRLGTNELVAIQTAWGIEPHNGSLFWERLRNVSAPSALLEVFTHGLKRSHAELSKAEIGDIIDTVGLEKAVTVFARALKWTMPDKSERTDPKAKTGTGAKS